MLLSWQEGAAATASSLFHLYHTRVIFRERFISPRRIFLAILVFDEAMGVWNDSKLRVLTVALVGIALLNVAHNWNATPEPSRCEGQRYDVMTVPGGRSPYIKLEADGRRGSFLLDYGTTQSSLSQNAFQKPSSGDGKFLLNNFSLPTFKSGSFDVRVYRLTVPPPGGQLGIIGTDFLSLLTADFSFHDGTYDVVLGGKSCDRDLLRKRGMIPVRQTGFFSSDPGHVDASRHQDRRRGDMGAIRHRLR
jgi:hypothetical protein